MFKSKLLSKKIRSKIQKKNQQIHESEQWNVRNRESKDDTTPRKDYNPQLWKFTDEALKCSDKNGIWTNITQKQIRFNPGMESLLHGGKKRKSQWKKINMDERTIEKRNSEIFERGRSKERRQGEKEKKKGRESRRKRGKEGRHWKALSKEIKQRCWKDSSVVQGTSCSCSGPRLGSQHPHSLQPSFETPVQGIQCLYLPL